MVKIANLLRSKPVDVKAAALNLLQAESHGHIILGKRKLSRMDAARWGYCFQCEADMRMIGKEDLTTIVNHVFAAKHIQKKKVVVGNAPRDDEHINEYAAYYDKMGRWARDAAFAIAQPWFWILLELSWAAKCPWQ